MFDIVVGVRLLQCILLFVFIYVWTINTKLVKVNQYPKIILIWLNIKFVFVIRVYKGLDMMCCRCIIYGECMCCMPAGEVGVVERVQICIGGG